MTRGPLRVYVAGESADLVRAERFIRRVQADERMRCTLDWVAEVRATRVPESELPNAQRLARAHADLRAIVDADVVVVLVSDVCQSRGVWVELGVCLGLREANPGNAPEVIVSGGARQSIFTAYGLVAREFASKPCDGMSVQQNDDAAIRVLKLRAAAREQNEKLS